MRSRKPTDLIMRRITVTRDREYKGKICLSQMIAQTCRGKKHQLHRVPGRHLGKDGKTHTVQCGGSLPLSTWTLAAFEYEPSNDFRV